MLWLDYILPKFGMRWRNQSSASPDESKWTLLTCRCSVRLCWCQKAHHSFLILLFTLSVIFSESQQIYRLCTSSAVQMTTFMIVTADSKQQIICAAGTPLPPGQLLLQFFPMVGEIPAWIYVECVQIVCIFVPLHMFSGLWRTFFLNIIEWSPTLQEAKFLLSACTCSHMLQIKDAISTVQPWKRSLVSTSGKVFAQWRNWSLFP